MDGHDNDTNSGANSSDSAQGGIFSTPDLTVNAENVAQPTQSGDERKRVASIFANTDTGRQAQRLNDAMEAQTAPVTEDLVIRNGSKKSKIPLIIIAIVSLIVAMGIAVFLIMNNLGSAETETQKTPLATFESYTQLLSKGPDDLQSRNTSGEWFLFNVDSMDLTNSEYNNYLVKIDTSYRDFLERNTHEDLSDGLAIHQRLLRVLINFYSLDRLNDTLMNKYIQDGDTLAQQYIRELVPIDPAVDDESENVLDIASSLEYDYLSTRLNILRIYETHNCIVGMELNTACVLGISDSQFQQEEQRAVELRESLASLIPIIENNFQGSVKAIRKNLE